MEPLTREEQYLNRLTGEYEQTLPEEPITRKEQYLSRLCGSDNIIPQEPLTREEQFLANLCGEEVDTPEPLTRLEQYMAFAGGESETKPASPLTRQEKYWDEYQGGAVPEEKTVTGNPISVSDALAKPAVSLKVLLNPKQDLHGYDHPWPAGGGKNKLPPIKGETKNGITVVANDDGSITLNGTATSSAQFRPTAQFQLKAGTYILSGNSDFPNTAFYLNGISGSTDTGSGSIVTLSEDTLIDAVVQVYANKIVNNVRLYLMIRLASETDPTFEPYSNICPISGWGEVSVNHSATSSDTPTTYTVTLAPVGDNIIPYDLDHIKSINSSRGEWDGDTYIDGGISYAFQPDGSVILNGTATSTSGVFYWMASVDPIVPLHVPEGYIFSGVSDGSLYSYFAGVDSHYCYGPEVLHESDTVLIHINVLRGTTLNNLRIKPAITPPVYGGTVDIVSGVLSVNYGTVDLGTLNFTPSSPESHVYRTDMLVGVIAEPPTNDDLGNAICSSFKNMAYAPISATDNGRFAIASRQSASHGRVVFIDHRFSSITEFVNGNANVQFSYELATPQTYQLTPQQVQMLLNDNYLTTEDGTITLTYMAKAAERVRTMNARLNKNKLALELKKKS